LLDDKASPSGPVLSRFLAKVALEAMAHRLVDYPEGLDHLVSEPQLDPIRNHARRGTTTDWPYHSRRIYDTNARCYTEEGLGSQTVHEFDILKTEWNEWFLVMALFGLELTINYGART
jgi:hypothetical protein